MLGTEVAVIYGTKLGYNEGKIDGDEGMSLGSKDGLKCKSLLPHTQGLHTAAFGVEIY